MEWLRWVYDPQISGLTVRTIREVSNGTWFLGSFAVWVSIGLYLFRTCGPYWPMRAFDIYWRGRSKPGTRMALAFFVFVTGSTMRAGYIWMLLAAQNDRNPERVHAIEQFFPVMILATMIAVLGSICILRLLSLPKNRPWNWLIPAALAVAVPIAYWYFSGGKDLP